MTKTDLLTAINQALKTLRAARKALATNSTSESHSLPVRLSTKTAKPARAKRGISEEGRQRIAEAQRKRWAVKKRAAKKAARLAAK